MSKMSKTIIGVRENGKWEGIEATNGYVPPCPCGNTADYVIAENDWQTGQPAMGSNVYVFCEGCVKDRLPFCVKH